MCFNSNSLSKDRIKFFKMNFNNNLFLAGFFFIVGGLFAQSKMNKSDSLFLHEKTVFVPSLLKGQTQYPLPKNPDGYTLELIGSDNLSVIAKTGAVFGPLNDMKVNLLFKATKITDGSQLEIPVAVKVQGEHSTSGANEKPFVIPSLREWFGYEGKLQLTKNSQIVVDEKSASSLIKAAEIFQSDIEKLAGIKLKVLIGKPKRGDIFMTLSGNHDELGKEGYLLNIQDFVTINAAEYKGVFWGTRTLLQILENDKAHALLPKGVSRDYPKYEVRGFLIDLGRKYFTIDFLRDYVKLMSYYKMGDFQLHLSDNAFVQHFNNDWDSTYSGFRLESETFPNLPTKGEFYSKKEFIDLQILAENYGITIIPEIDVPAHSLAFTKAFPQIASAAYGKDHLDINNPETYTIIEKVFKEYLEGDNPVFRSKEIHIGTDEYNKKEAESFRKFTDHFIKYVQTFGKEVRVWGALTHAEGITPVTNKGVTMNAWYNGYADPIKMKALGYPLISTPDGWLYIVPAAGYYYDYLNLKMIYEKWEPVNIGEITFKMGDPFIRGGMFAVWNDVAKNGITAQDVTDRVFPALQVLSEKMWGGKDESVPFDIFSAKAKTINEDPATNLRGKIEGQNKLVLNYKMDGKDKNLKTNNGATFKKEGDSKVLNFSSKQSFVNLPVDEIGYNYTVCFKINPSQNNAANSVLFKSNHAVVKLKQGETTNIGFSHEGKDYDFGVSIPENKWTAVAISGDNNSTSLYLDGKLAKKLTREKVATGFKTDSIYVMKTLFFPLKTIGDGENSFVGKIKELQVFNQILTEIEIQAIKNEE